MLVFAVESIHGRRSVVMLDVAGNVFLRVEPSNVRTWMRTSAFASTLEPERVYVEDDVVVVSISVAAPAC